MRLQNDLFKSNFCLASLCVTICESLWIYHPSLPSLGQRELENRLPFDHTWDSMEILVRFHDGGSLSPRCFQVTQPVASKDCLVGLVGLPRVHQNWDNLHNLGLETAWLCGYGDRLQATKLDMLWHSDTLPVTLRFQLVNMSWSMKTILVNSGFQKKYLASCRYLFSHIFNEAPAKMAQKFQELDRSESTVCLSTSLKLPKLSAIQSPLVGEMHVTAVAACLFSNWKVELEICELKLFKLFNTNISKILARGLCDGHDAWLKNKGHNAKIRIICQFTFNFFLVRRDLPACQVGFG